MKGSLANTLITIYWPHAIILPQLPHWLQMKQEREIIIIEN